MPNQRKPGKSAHTFWIDTDLWQAVKAKASERGETASDAVLRALKRYVR